MKAFIVFVSFLFSPFVDAAFFGMSKLFGCITTEAECPNQYISFFLYTRNTELDPVILDLSDPESVKYAKYAINKPLKLLIHGFTGDKDYSPNSQMRPAYFEHDDYNIISVDYKELAKSPCYFSAVRNLPVVANCTAQLINFMIDQNIFDLDSIHVIGFSLGAQVAGMVANYMPEGRKLKRITGLT